MPLRFCLDKREHVGNLDIDAFDKQIDRSVRQNFFAEFFANHCSRTVVVRLRHLPDNGRKANKEKIFNFLRCLQCLNRIFKIRQLLQNIIFKPLVTIGKVGDTVNMAVFVIRERALSYRKLCNSPSGKSLVLVRARNREKGSTSTPTLLRSNIIASKFVVPLPVKGSRMKSPF